MENISKLLSTPLAGIALVQAQKLHNDNIKITKKQFDDSYLQSKNQHDESTK